MNPRQNILLEHVSEEDAIALLRNNMQNQKEWIKVHAAEFLLWSGHQKGVSEIFLNEEKNFGTQSPYRIGIWRILAQTETEQEKKDIWIDKIINAFLDEKGSDRLHAIETLAKLKISVFDANSKLTDILITDTLDSFAVYKLWNFAYSSEENFWLVQDRLLKIAISEDRSPLVKIISAYTLKKMGVMDGTAWRTLAETALSTSSDLSVQVVLLNTAIVTANQEMAQTALYVRAVKELFHLNEKEYNNNFKMSLLDTLAEKGDKEDLELLYSIFNTIKTVEDAATVDLLSSCAYAILMIEKKNKTSKTV
ncbi:MAG: hypothetical protein WCZ43_05075 [Proteiniphilum sp.]